MAALDYGHDDRGIGEIMWMWVMRVMGVLGTDLDCRGRGLQTWDWRASAKLLGEGEGLLLVCVWGGIDERGQQPLSSPFPAAQGNLKRCLSRCFSFY